MRARIYKPTKTAMQSGRYKTREWVLEYEPEFACKIESLMGYTSSTDMSSQVKMKFPSLERAKSYCKKRGISFQVQNPHQMQHSTLSYADNFSYKRSVPWTH